MIDDRGNSAATAAITNATSEGGPPRDRRISNEQLLAAVAEGDIERVGEWRCQNNDHIVARGGDDIMIADRINGIRDGDGNTVLHLAARNGHFDLTKWLMEEFGFRLDAGVRNGDGWTPLHCSAQYGHLDIIRYLIMASSPHGAADASAKSITGNLPLHIASYTGQLHVIRFFVEECGIDINTKGEAGYTPLNALCQNGHLTVVQSVMAQYGKDADLNIYNDSGWTPLHSAAFNGYWEVARFLIEELGQYHSPFSFCRETPLYFASRNGHLPTVRYFVEVVGVDTKNYETIDRRTIAFPAAGGNHVAVLRYLLERDAVDINAQEQNGFQALHLACKNGSFDAVKCLMESGKAELDTPAAQTGWTPLHMFMHKGCLEEIKYMLRYDEVDVNKKTKQELTTLQIASYFGRWEVVKHLVEQYRMDVDVQDALGVSPLHAAAQAQENHFEVAQYLVHSCGSHINTTDNSGSSPMHVALARGHDDMLECILRGSAARP
eukprot:CAMPEP_0119556368 /NCGR_PEP_ID=MMETSP1352-20130426/8354_1 /TAXON_ID=265584 /ORGANISM="Stauroneis constricta, Strain CCMP1120" /LENGTH=492 /DNA_ID=CAMNT_0007603321 /DNA_START=52 /DNA_END=1530 /DNA_ORIENTATION=+